MVWFEFDSFQFEADTGILRRDGQVVPLTPKAADLLLVFLEHPSTLFSKKELKLKVWPDVTIVDDTNLFYQLSIVREALAGGAADKVFIQTISKRGYRFVVPVTKIWTEKEITGPSRESPEPPWPERQGGNSAVAETSSPRAKSTAARPWVFAAMAGTTLALLTLTFIQVYRRPSTPPISVAGYNVLTHDGMQKLDGTLLTDGVRVYFREQNRNGTAFTAVPVGGGETGPVPLSTRYASIYDLRPQTSELLTGPPASDAESGDLWIVPMVGESRRRIENIHAGDAKWSPDGKQIAFTSNRDLYTVNANGTGLLKIAAAPGPASCPRWSPDGRLLRFTVGSPETADEFRWVAIWEVRSDGLNLHPLLAGWNNPPNERCGIWTSDGNFFIFQATREGHTDLWALQEKPGVFGGRRRMPICLTSGLEGYSSPIPGTDGKQIFAIGSEARGELVHYDLKSKQFAPFLGGIEATWVTFSSSSRYVAYIRYRDQTVWRANADGGSPSQITYAPFQADGLSWSQDEKWLLLRGKSPGHPWNIYRVPSSGGHPEALIPSATEQGIPSLSADGKRIAFGDVPPTHTKPVGSEIIHILDLNDHTLSELPGSNGLWSARWSPDGRFLVASTIKDRRLKLLDLKSHQWRWTEADSVSNSTWSYDSKFVYFHTDGHVVALRRVSVDDGHVEELFDVTSSSYPDLSWWWSGVAPDNSPLILRNLGSNEVYSLTLQTQ